MQSTLSVFPASKKALDATKIPFVLYTQPIPEDLYIIINNKIQIPRCPNPNCTAFFNSLCTYNKHSWICSVCGQHASFNSINPKNKNSNKNLQNDQNNVKNNSDNQKTFLNDTDLFSSITSTLSYQIIDPSVTFPLTHVIIIGCGNQESKQANENDESISSSLLPAATIMQSLPPEAPVWVFIMNTPETARKLVTTAGNFNQLSKLPKSSVRVPIKTTIPLLLSLLNAKKSCFWCRVFCSGGTIDSMIIDKLKQIDRIPIRIDFFIDSPITFSGSSSSTSSESYFANNVPGVIRFFYYSSSPISNKKAAKIRTIVSTPSLSPKASAGQNFPTSVSISAINDKNTNNSNELFNTFENIDILNSAIDTAASDCARPFGFQCKVIVKCGKLYKASIDSDKATLSVIASSRSVVPFNIIPQSQTNSISESNSINSNITSTSSLNNINSNLAHTSSSSKSKLVFQAVQVLAHVHIWDPPTNTLKKCTNVINCDFPVSSNTSTLISSASPSALFDFWARHNKLHLIEKMKQEFDNMKSLLKMYQTVSSNNSPLLNTSSSAIATTSATASTSVNQINQTVLSSSSKKKSRSHSIDDEIDLSWRYGNLNLANKNDFDAFCTEFFALCPPTTWRFVLGTFIETWKADNSNEVIVIIVKKFPNVYFALKEGVEVLFGDAIRMFVELCKPLSIKVQQCSFEQILAKFKDEIASSQSSG